MNRTIRILLAASVVAAALVLWLVQGGDERVIPAVSPDVETAQDVASLPAVDEENEEEFEGAAKVKITGTWSSRSGPAVSVTRILCWL